jgi:pyruvyltransferase
MPGDFERLNGFRGGARVREALLRTPGVFSDRPRAFWFRGVANFGDELSPQILSWVLGRQPIWVSRRYSGKVISTGSILTAVARGDTVWGSGLIRPERCVPPARVRFLAVRGPLTRDCIAADVPEIYGDPAMLVPMFYSPPVEKTHEIGVVPHYTDAGAIGEVDSALRVIDVRDPWQVVGRCNPSVSGGSVLLAAWPDHRRGLWYTGELDHDTNRLVGGGFKFRDYYLGTGRDVAEPTPWESGVSVAIDRTAPVPSGDVGRLLDAAGSILGQAK